jgi:NAD(P)H-quinone oxidoreductase subunit 5
MNSSPETLLALSSWPPLGPWTFLALCPLLYALAAWASGSPRLTLVVNRGWAQGLSALAALVGGALALWVASVGPLAGAGPLNSSRFIGTDLRLDLAPALVLALVGFIGWVIARYSSHAMAGEHAERRYWRHFFGTLGFVSVVALTNHLLVLALAWLATGLTLHGLLTHFDRRAAALVAAHKKFLVSRLADLGLLSAVALVAWSLGTLRIDEVLATAQALPRFPLALQAAVVLLAISALLKCAQLPFHVWLIQVMEAPTPVSALLHAGVVNLGGLVLIRFSPMVQEVPAAQALLVVVGGLTAALAALTMMTRISIKVMLAWSTCAQMGFMLVQIGLGLPHMALLHLLAHSLYKAHAFLSAGGVVAQARSGLRAVPASGKPSWAGELQSAALALVLAAAAAWIWGWRAEEGPLTLVWVWILGLALAPLLAPSLQGQSATPVTLRVLACGGAAIGYFGLHHLFAQSLGWTSPATGSTAPILLLALIGLLFGALFALQAAIRVRPQAPALQRLHPWFFGGLFLDEWFTRTTFRVWPAKHTGVSA